METIKIEELVALKERGMSDQAIADYFTNQKRKISQSTVSIRLREYYKLQGKEKPRTKRKSVGKRRIDISDEELVVLKEQGQTDQKIAEYFTSEKRKISRSAVSTRLMKYYKSQGKEKTRTKRKSEKNNEQKSIQQTKVKRERKYDDELKEIFMTGMTVQEYVEEFEDEEKLESLELKFNKVRLLAMCAGRDNDKYVQDNDFIEVIDMVENPEEILKKYMSFLKPWVSDGKCKKGRIDLIRDKVFNGNTDLMMYVLARLNITYYKGYDVRVSNMISKQYEQKINKYLNRLQSIEDNRRKNKINSEIVNQSPSAGETR